MASIINSVAFKNFYNYYGDFHETKYDFKEGINIVVADNGCGKSKFFNAFLWLFEDRVLDSEDKIKKSVRVEAYKIISDKAKAEASIGDVIECGIEVVFSTPRWKYQIIKSFDAVKLHSDYTRSESWQINLRDVEVNKTDHVLTKFSPVFGEADQNKIIDQLIIPTLRQYSFLQGEEMDSIIDFSHKASIKDAVRTLTDISKYEELVSSLSELKEKANKDLKKQSKTNDEQNENYNNALSIKAELEDKIIKEKEKLDQYSRTYEDAEAEKNKLESDYSNAEKRKDLDDLIKDKERKHKAKQEEYINYLDSINGRFFDGNFSWIGKGFEGVSKVFGDKITTFRENHFKKKALKDIKDGNEDNFFFLPIGSPDAVSLAKMVEDKKCYVCMTDAPDGSLALENLKKLKNRPTSKVVNNFVKNDLDQFFGDLQINAQPFYNKIENILESINRTREKVTELNDKVNVLNTDLKSLKSQRKNILISGSNSEHSPLSIMSRYSGAIRRMDTAGNSIEVTKQRLVEYNKNLKNTENEIKSLLPKDIETGYILNYDILNDLHNAAQIAQDRVFDNMVLELERYANIHFKNLIKYNDLSGGILKFEKSPSGSIHFNYIDSENNIVYGASEGFQRMKKFSVVMAVISANTEQFNYPLLADAPLSAFGAGFTEGFFESTEKVFPQSIILVKEFYDANDEKKLSHLGNKILKEDYIKSFYLNVVPRDAEQKDIVTTTLKYK